MVQASIPAGDMIQNAVMNHKPHSTLRVTWLNDELLPLSIHPMYSFAFISLHLGS